ncbi:MAG: hypothetical protein AAB592_03300 [Patescibacteria group bacterium]
MKLFFLVGSVISTVLILIVGFQNFGSTINDFYIFFVPVDLNPSLIVFGLAFLGMLAGGFYFGFMSSLMKDEEEPGGSMEA